MKTPLITSALLLFSCILLVHLSSYSQVVDSTVGIELSIPQGDHLKKLNECSSFNNEVFVILNNDTDSIVRFYENWNSYGYYNFTFEIKTNDSTYLISRPHKLWYRNFPSHHSVFPNESIVFRFDLIDSTCASNRTGHRALEDGWIGFPNQSDTALIRVIYSIPSELASYPDRTIRKDDYSEYLDAGDIKETIKTKPKTKKEGNKGRIYIFSQTLISEWQEIITSR